MGTWSGGISERAAVARKEGHRLSILATLAEMVECGGPVCLKWHPRGRTEPGINEPDRVVYIDEALRLKIRDLVWVWVHEQLDKD